MNFDLPSAPLLGPGEEIPEDLWPTLGVARHAVAPLPDVVWLRTHALAELVDFLNDREEAIRRMTLDPLNHGWEPATWKILDALCGFPWADPSIDAIVAETDPVKKAALRERKAWALSVRRKLIKQDSPWRVILLNGGNRGSKTEWAASRVMRLLLWKAGARAWCFHQDADMSVEYQQSALYRYLPAELKTEKGIRRNPTYVAYKPQTGFSEQRFTLHNAAGCSLRNYQQAFEKIQGGELDVVWCDELVPATWVKELKARVATRGGWLILTFTPISGYTPTVRMFLDRAQVTVESTAFVLPEDGGKPELELALQGEDALAWLAESEKSESQSPNGSEFGIRHSAFGIPTARAQPSVPEGRRFKRVPRVMRMVADPTHGVFFFHTFDNPFGNPRNVYELYKADTSSGQLMRFYGVATKAMTGQFPKFNSMVHVIAADQVPKKGTRFQITDPCSGRNWAMGWAVVDRTPKGKRITFYREWPCPGKYVPGVGDMGPWAEPGDKLDGEKGPAQRSLGWGTERYRGEIFRLEGRAAENVPPPASQPTKFDQWDTEDPKPEVRRRRHRPEDGELIYERLMDCRAGNTPTQTRAGVTTLLDDCEGLGFEPNYDPAPGAQTNDDRVHWVQLINNLLDYDEEKPRDTYNTPQLFFSEDCANFIFAMQNWTNADGLDGACMDFIALVKYLVLHDPDDWQGKREREEEAA